MATDDRISYRLVVRESPLRARYDALLATLRNLHFEVEADGRELYLTPSPEGLQLLIERRKEFQAALEDMTASSWSIRRSDNWLFRL